MRIVQIVAIAKMISNGKYIDVQYGLGEDNKLYQWDWKTGEWELYQKPVEGE